MENYVFLICQELFYQHESEKSMIDGYFLINKNISCKIKSKKIF